MDPNLTHTPGPWEINAENYITRHGNVVASVTRYGVGRVIDGELLPWKTWQANVKLIASAPTLLQALRDCVTDDSAACFALGETGLRRRLEAINAIAKAAVEKGTL